MGRAPGCCILDVIPALVSTATDPTAADPDPWRILLPLLMLAGIVLVAWVVIVSLRRKLRLDQDDRTLTFSLEDLRQMHSNGDLTDEEFSKAQKVLYESMQNKSSD